MTHCSSCLFHWLLLAGFASQLVENWQLAGEPKITRPAAGSLHRHLFDMPPGEIDGTVIRCRSNF